VKDSDPVQPVDPERIEAIRPLLAPCVRDMIDVQLAAAMRPGELVRMQPGLIERRRDVWIYRLPFKRADREIYLGPRAREHLAGYVERRAEEEPLFQPREAWDWYRARRHAARTTPLHYGNRPGFSRTPTRGFKVVRRAFSTSCYRQQIRRACRKAGVEVWHPHQLRHTAATTIRAAYGAEAARVVLGHSKLSTTELYAERDLKLARRVIQECG